MLHVISLIIVFLLSFSINYFSLLQDKKREARQNITRIELILEKNFEYSERLLNFVGKKISSHDNFKDPEKIYNIFTDTAHSQGYNNIFSWSMFDWVDRQDKKIVTTIGGVNIKNPEDVSARKYFWRGVNGGEFWDLHISEPAIGNTSHIPVLPIGIRIPNKDNSYIGSIEVGIDIRKLTSEIETQLVGNGKFALINGNNYNFVLGSNNINHDIKNKDLEEYSKKTRLLSDQHEFSYTGFLDKSFAIGDDIFIHSLLLRGKYPYIVLSGYSHDDFIHQVTTDSLLFLGKAIIIAMVIRLLENIHAFVYINKALKTSRKFIKH